MVDFLRQRKKVKSGKPNEPKVLIDRVQAFIEKYQVQVYSFVLVVVVAILAYLLGFARKSIVERGELVFSGLRPPEFSQSASVITAYDGLDSVSWAIEDIKVYKYEANMMGRVMQAARALGFSGEAEYDSYREVYSWENETSTLIYSATTGVVDFHGETDMVWPSEAEIKSGVSELFGVSTEGYRLEDTIGGDFGKYYFFAYYIDDTRVYCEGDSRVMTVDVDGGSKMYAFKLYLIDVVDSGEVPLLSQQVTKDGIGSLPKMIDAKVYKSGVCDSPDCYIDPVYEPSGGVNVASAGIAYYKSRPDAPFLVPVLELSGVMTTLEGYTGGATVLVDVVDWEAVQQ